MSSLTSQAAHVHDDHHTLVQIVIETQMIQQHSLVVLHDEAKCDFAHTFLTLLNQNKLVEEKTVISVGTGYR